MLKRLKVWWYSVKSNFKAIPTEDMVVAKTLEVKECARDMAARKRVRKAFEQQSQAIQARALKPHSCDDPLTCARRVCFRPAPDKIVSGPYEVKKKQKK